MAIMDSIFIKRLYTDMRDYCRLYLILFTIPLAIKQIVALESINTYKGQEWNINLLVTIVKWP